jgi:hypothetical protein
MYDDAKQVQFHSQFQESPLHEMCANLGLQPFQTAYVRNDHLTVDKFDRGHNVFEYHWWHHVTNNSILLLNRGAHYEESARVYDTMRHVLRRIQATYPGALVFYRATAIPVPEERFSSNPQTEPMPWQAIDSAHVPAAYGWSHFHEQNVELRHMMRTEFPNYVFLDVEYMTRFRTDTHRDPIHPCVPGFADWWLAFFTDALMEVNRIE